MDSDQEQSRLEMSDESEMAAAKAAAELAAAQTGGGDNDVVIIDPSPTNFDPNKMPKTIESNVYTCASNQAYSNRVRIFKLLGQCDSKVKELEELEEERGEGESEDEYSEDIRKELVEDMTKIKVYLDAHSEFSHKLGLMANYIMDVRPGVAVESCKLKRDAKEALDKSVKDEEAVEEKVATWKRTNRKWLRPKKKRKGSR